MSVDIIQDETIEKFLVRVIEIEESPAFLKGGQDSARRERIESALDEFCKLG